MVSVTTTQLAGKLPKTNVELSVPAELYSQSQTGGQGMELS